MLRNCGCPANVVARGTGFLLNTSERRPSARRCGSTFRIQSGENATERSDSARPSSGRDGVSEAPAPVNLDVYGLNEDAMAPLSRGSPLGESSPTSHDSDGPAPLPSRLKPYQPLSESQKKKIAKRAAKIEKTKASSATVGVSFGAVLAFALIGWRIYRIFNRIERAANRANAEQSAPAEIYVNDPNTAMSKLDREVGVMIAQPTTSEARDWLDPTKYPNHAVTGMPAQTAREMVAGFYERGAEKVYILDPSSVNGTYLAGQFAVRLPKDRRIATSVSSGRRNTKETNRPLPTWARSMCSSPRTESSLSCNCHNDLGPPLPFDGPWWPNARRVDGSLDRAGRPDGDRPPGDLHGHADGRRPVARGAATAE